MCKSVAPSQLASGSATPRRDDQRVDSTLSSPLFSAQLQERLRQVDGVGSPTPTGSPAPSGTPSGTPTRNRIVHSIEVLSEDRRKTSALAREQALGVLLREVVVKYDPALMHFDLFSAIVHSFSTARSEVEGMTVLQLVCASLPLVVASDDVRAEDSMDLAKQLCSGLLKRATSSSASVELRQAELTSFAVLTYYLNAGGGGYGIEAVVGQMLEVAESSPAEGAGVAAAALGGAALLTTLASPATTNSIASDWLFSLVPMLDALQLVARLAAAKFLAVLVERCDRSALKSGDNHEACEELIASLEAMAQESTAKTAKRDKKVQSLLVKSVLKLLEARLGDNDEDDEDREEDVEIVSQFHKNFLRKSMGITSWSALIVVEHLTWVFGPGLHNQLAVNPGIQALLKKEDVHIAAGAPEEGETDSHHTFHNLPQQKADDAKRSRDLRKDQLRKAEDHGLID